MVEEEIINDAVLNLKRLTTLKKIDFNVAGPLYDYDMTINGIAFACEVKTLVNKANFNLALQKLHQIKNATNKPSMLLAGHIVPDLFARFQEERINVIEANGNCCITEDPLYIHISGQKATPSGMTERTAFNEVGLKLIFYFLKNDNNINKPYREISKECGLSLGTIKNVVEKLNKHHYVLTTEKGRILKNRKGLLDLWQAHFNQILKPKLLIKELDFVDDQTARNWESIILPEGMCWGGEGGAFLLDHYLTPGQFDIYTEVPSIQLLMTKKVRFQNNGRIKLYQKFWEGEIDEKVAPKILVYADLMGSGNSRCIEAAQRLVENGI